MPQILVSDRVQLLMPYHILFDELEEERLAEKSFGSTKSSIAPFYSDKYLKMGIQINVIYDDAFFVEKLKDICVKKNALIESIYGGKETISFDEIYIEICSYRDRIEPFLVDTTIFLNNAITKNRNVILEGQLGALKDPDNGIYPFV